MPQQTTLETKKETGNLHNRESSNLEMFMAAENVYDDKENGQVSMKQPHEENFADVHGVIMEFSES